MGGEGGGEDSSHPPPQGGFADFSREKGTRSHSLYMCNRARLGIVFVFTWDKSHSLCLWRQFVSSLIVCPPQTKTPINVSFINNCRGQAWELTNQAWKGQTFDFLSLALCSGCHNFETGTLHKHSAQQEEHLAIRTGVVSSGVVMGVQELFSFTPLPKSKSQIFTGDTCKRKKKPEITDLRSQRA